MHWHCHNILFVFGLISFWHLRMMSLIRSILIVVYWSVLHLILDSTWVWYSLLLELKIPTLVWHWDYFLCREHWEVYSLQVMRTQLETERGLICSPAFLYSLAHARVNLQAKAFMSAWKPWSLIHWHVFDSDAVDKPLRPMANRFCGCFVWALAPFCVLFLCFAVCFAVSAGETQVWLGDLRVVVFGWLLFFLCVVLIDLPPQWTLYVLVQMSFLLMLM